ncbi:LysR substrate-binding domain-containing protein [Paenibacillus radicis (ex Gao et al. 2016)]|uniref:LysR family transcriptional regulator n=1 Tax=Paenibacillus radicis (ex Gao et al. 2016) TaxID=1737354 RepID=A0A917LVK3_9BACL|nr:LysR substrate-binding domain-containing protein [Paenibacillus radicis (ex Gao et al. 2016)]GGG59765.1 LysR family transcriptional regulator [Paenibacillus radicis (ex Gao et al. 2016)]
MAADYCNYSQSAVSQIIIALENEFGIKLLNRSHAGVSVTSDGEELLPYIQKLSQAYNELSDKVSELHGIESGLIRIGTFSSISCHLLSPLLKDFKAKHPNIKFELIQGDYRQIETWISEGTVDFGFLSLPTLKEFEVIPIMEDRMLAILPANHPYAHEEIVPLSIFEQESMILLEEGTKKEVLEMFRQHHIKAKIEYRLDDDYTIISMVENGLGISILAELILKRIPYNILSKETSPSFSRSIGIAIKSRKQASIAVRCFLDFIVENKESYIHLVK